IASPLRRLAAVAHELPDDLDRRVDETSGPVEVRSVAHALNSTATRLSGLIRRTQRVAADASHHLRTPLTGVRLRLEAIEDLSDQAEVQAEAQAATHEVDRLARRIEQVLALARSDAGTAHFSPQAMSQVVGDRAEAAAGMFAERGVDLETSLEPGVFVSAPVGVIAQVTDELLGNALQYARSRVLVSLHVTARTAVLLVEDDGPGLPAEDREAVFERFRRGSTAAPGGSGLGLALVRESVAGIGGRATATASRWDGFAVQVTVPCADTPVGSGDH
ncbi:MAG: HAMP domain-containing sensor histidine kinase, partial [Candidatus Nanopelagicales bacterium]